MIAAKLPKWFPWMKGPAIISAPMLGTATPTLAAEVTKAGGLGFLGSIAYHSHESEHIKRLESDLREVRSLLDQGPSDTIPIGVSFLTRHESVVHFKDTALPIVKKHKPAAAWLFAPDGVIKPHKGMIAALKGLATPPKVFVQVGNVAAAREAAEDGADALVCQGIDAGGHQFRRGMGVVSLVPEVKRMLMKDFSEREIAVIAAGGIVSGEGLAAALALGAEGIVMGTRFTVADESAFPEHRKDLVVQTSDGGSTTFKSHFCDDIVKNPLWGALYDGRAIITPVHEKYMSGATFEECEKMLEEDFTKEEVTTMLTTWAGTGVGLVTKRQPAGEIVREVQAEAREIIQQLTVGQ